MFNLEKILLIIGKTIFSKGFNNLEKCCPWSSDVFAATVQAATAGHQNGTITDTICQNILENITRKNACLLAFWAISFFKLAYLCNHGKQAISSLIS